MCVRLPLFMFIYLRQQRQKKSSWLVNVHSLPAFLSFFLFSHFLYLRMTSAQSLWVECWMSLENITSNRLCTYFTAWLYSVVYSCCTVHSHEWNGLRLHTHTHSFRMVWLITTHFIEVIVVKLCFHHRLQFIFGLYYPQCKFHIHRISLRHNDIYDSELLIARVFLK